MKIGIPVIVLCLLLSTAMFSGFTSRGQNTSCSDSGNDVFDGRIVQLKGKVTILNHSDLGKTPGNGMSLVFQRDGCNKCLVMARSDSNGNYEIFLGEGKYHLIVREVRCDYGGLGCECYDLLARGQARYVELKKNPNPTLFDVDVSLPKR